jgi:hypothetical protein
MAVYEGIRLRPGFLGRGSAPARRSHVLPRPASGGTAGSGKARAKGGATSRSASGISNAGPFAGARPIQAVAGARPMAGTGARAGAVAATSAGVAASFRPAHATLPLDRRPAGDSVPRRRARERLRAGRRSGRLGLLLGGIVIAFMLAFFSLAQTVRVTATDYQMNRLLDVQAQLQAQRQELISDLARLGQEPAIRRQAINLGLFPLAEPVVVRSR